jgi:DNA mismatch repair protein MSH5
LTHVLFFLLLSQNEKKKNKQKRHPLSELCVETFIPNTIQLAGGADRAGKVMLVSGANFSGKSVILKQAALAVFMAHVGLFVPCERARIGIVDGIYARVQTRETVSKVRNAHLFFFFFFFASSRGSFGFFWGLQGQSAFMIDLSQVSGALTGATSRSLVVLDEFGKGTLANGTKPFSSILVVLFAARLFRPGLSK